MEIDAVALTKAKPTYAIVQHSEEAVHVSD